jgi:HEPN domain-containing protein
MVNKTYALEWLNLSYHDYNGAELLFQANHYTDTISYVIQQSLEKALKSILASQNKPIKKIHNLLEIYDLVKSDNFTLDNDERMLLSIATLYYTKQKYPTQDKRLPSREEIREVIDFTYELFNKICKLLNIDPEEVKN